MFKDHRPKLRDALSRALTGLLMVAVSLAVGAAAVAQSAHPPAPPWWDIVNWVAWFHQDPQGATILLVSAVGSGGGFALTVFQVWFSRSAREAEARHAARLEALERTVVAQLNNVQETQQNVSVSVAELPEQVAKYVLQRLTERNRLLEFDVSKHHELTASIPPRPLRCLGRSQEINAVIACLVNERGPSSVIVFGGPGLGKSTLVCEVAYRKEIAARYDQRVLFVQLEHIGDAGAMVGAVASALNIEQKASIGEMMSSLGSASSMLILDNLETVWNADAAACEAQLRSLEQFSPSTTLVATFRGTDLPAAPRWTLRQNVSPLTEEISRELFLEFAQNISAHDPILPKLLGELGGVPLAIELVALEAAPFNTLNQVWAQWQKAGTSLARRRHTQADRTTSLEFSIELSLGSPSRSPETFDALSIVALLQNGLDEVLAEKILGESFYNGIRDLVSCGLGFRSRGRIDVLPPIRRYVIATYGITEDLIRRLISTYWSLALSLFGPVTGVDSAIDTAVLAEDRNFQMILIYAATRIETRAFLSLSHRVVEYYKRSIKRIIDLPPNQVNSYIRFIRGFSAPLVYQQHLARINENFKDWIQSSTLGYECECLVDDLMMPTLYRQLQLMEEGLPECTPEVRLELEPRLAELRRVYDNYVENVAGGPDQPNREEGWEAMLGTIAMDDEKVLEETKEYFKTEGENIPLDDNAIRAIEQNAPRALDPVATN